MRSLITWARRNPAIVIGVSALAGWAIGSGLVPISLPFGSAAAAPAPTVPGAGSPPVPAAASFATSSASMPPAPAAAPDPFGGYGI
jgi:hypothetical protein